MKVLTNSQNVVLAISSVATMVSNGILLDDFVLGIAVENGQFVGTIPTIYTVDDALCSGKVAQKWCYDEVNGFVENANYEEPYDEQLATKKETSECQTEMSVANDAIISLVESVLL